MAASTVAIDSNVKTSGNHHIVTGTIGTADGSGEEARIAPSSGAVLYINAHPTADHSDAPEFRLNMEDDGSTASSGLVYIRTAAAQTVRFTAGVIL